MSCTRPLRLFYTYPYKNADGFERYRSKVCSSSIDHLEETETGLWPVESSEVGKCRRVFRNWINVPCGNCLGCRLDQSRTWANRLMCEYLYHDPNECWFLTLTYDNENVPRHFFVDDSTGEVGESLSLEPSHCTKFIKDLRNYTCYRYPEKKIRFFLSGEYGERTKRPHYHAILFGCPLDRDQLFVWKHSCQGFTLFRSTELEKIWSMGNCLVSPVSWSTCCYVARYVAKKLGKTPFLYEKLNIVPEFSRMSRRPGIGYQYLVDHPDVIETGVHLSLPDQGRNFSAPRYFKSFSFQNECDILHTDIQQCQSDYESSLQFLSGLDFQDFQLVQENALSEKISRSQRDF